MDGLYYFHKDFKCFSILLHRKVKKSLLVFLSWYTWSSWNFASFKVTSWYSNSRLNNCPTLVTSSLLRKPVIVNMNEKTQTCILIFQLFEPLPRALITEGIPAKKQHEEDLDVARGSRYIVVSFPDFFISNF